MNEFWYLCGVGTEIVDVKFWGEISMAADFFIKIFSN